MGRIKPETMRKIGLGGERTPQRKRFWHSKKAYGIFKTSQNVFIIERMKYRLEQAAKAGKHDAADQHMKHLQRAELAIQEYGSPEAASEALLQEAIKVEAMFVERHGKRA